MPLIIETAEIASLAGEVPQFSKRTSLWHDMGMAVVSFVIYVVNIPYTILLSSCLFALGIKF